MKNEANTKIEEISSERFTYENYESNYWDRLGLGYSCSYLDVVKKAKERCVGWCDASRLSVRPRTGEIAVLCEDEYGYFWFHMSECVKRAFIEEEEYNELNNVMLKDITKEKFEKYEEAIKIPDYNPPEKSPWNIASHSGLEQDEVWTIIRNYDDLKRKFRS